MKDNETKTSEAEARQSRRDKLSDEQQLKVLDGRNATARKVMFQYKLWTRTEWKLYSNNQDKFPYFNIFHPQDVLNRALDEFGRPYWVLVREAVDVGEDPADAAIEVKERKRLGGN